MAYVGFDLDSTLGCFAQVTPFLYYLYSPWALYESHWSGRFGSTAIFPGAPLSAGLRQKFKKALREFVRCILEKETAGEFHFLRPSLVPIAKRLSELKAAGLVSGVSMYSNNMSLGNLHFAAELIEQSAEIPSELFCRFLHIYHPLRQQEIDFGYAGEILADKHPQTLYHGFMSAEKCAVKPASYQEFVNSLYFFDDVKHPFLISALGKRYVHVKPYNYYSASFDSLFDCFVKAFQNSGLADDAEYYQYNIRLFQKYKGEHGPDRQSLEGIRVELQKQFYRSTKGDSFPDDTKLLQIFDAMFPPPPPPRLTRSNALEIPISKNEFSKALATLRRLETRKNRGQELPATNQQALQNAERVISFYEAQNPEQEGGRRGKKTRRRRRRSHAKRKV